jgi:hypothetical protein
VPVCRLVYDRTGVRSGSGFGVSGEPFRAGPAVTVRAAHPDDAAEFRELATVEREVATEEGR